MSREQLVSLVWGLGPVEGLNPDPATSFSQAHEASHWTRASYATVSRESLCQAPRSAQTCFGSQTTGK